MTLSNSKPRRSQISLLFAAIAIFAFVALGGPNRVLTHWAYAVESGKIQASNEQLAELNENLASIEKVSHAFRLVARVTAPSVVHLRVRGAIETAEELSALRAEREELRDQQRDLTRELRRTDNEELVPRLEELTEQLTRIDIRIRRLENSGPRGTGSGVIFDERGYIVTNNHVVEGQRDIFVTLYDEREFRGQLVGADPATDLAVVKIDATDLRPLEFGDSDAMQVGDWVLAIGAPFGLSQTVTHGIISATNRNDIFIRRGVRYQDFLQTDAAINPGNSGGPLVNLRGQVVGINTAIASEGNSNDGVAFTIPSNTVMRVATQLRDSGEVARGWLGITLSELTQDDADRLDLRNSRGVMVDAVYEGSPADAGGLMVEDIILRINGRRVRDMSHLQVLVANVFPGETARFGLFRDGKEVEERVTVGRRPSERELARQTRSQRSNYTRMLPNLPVAVRSLREALPSTIMNHAQDQALVVDLIAHTEDDREGVAVISVEGPARQLNLKPGELITQVNGRSVSTVARLGEMLSGVRTNETLTLKVFTPEGEERTVEYTPSRMN